MIHSHPKSRIKNRNDYCAWAGYHWWFYNYHPSTIRCKWVIAISVFCVSVIILFYIPATNTTTTTTNIKKNKNEIRSKFTNHTVVTFHLAFTVPKFTILNQRCIESIFYFHPKARVIIHSNLENGIHTAEQHVLEPIQQLIDLGYHIEVIPYTAANILQRAMTLSNSIVDTTLANAWMSLISTRYSQEIYWYSNESNLLRLCLLYVDGGIYLDTDVILVRPMVPVIVEPSSNNDSISNTINSATNVVTDFNGLDVDNVMARDGGSFECAVMKFLLPGNVFLGHAINDFIQHYNGTQWGNNGPRVFGRTSKALPSLLCPEPYNYTVTTASTINQLPSCSMQPLPSESFQPVPWRKWLTFCFDTTKSPVGLNATMIIRQPNVYAVHMNNHIFGKEIERHIYVRNSICDIAMTKFCILCE